jgi:hypothetical protein
MRSAVGWKRAIAAQGAIATSMATAAGIGQMIEQALRTMKQTLEKA